MGVEERLQSAGFRKVEEDSDESCALCDYYTRDEKGDAICELHRATFWEEFNECYYACDRFDGSRWNGLINGILEEQAKKEAEGVTQTEPDQNNDAKTNKKEGCYIATAVYGSYDASEVLVLREFRDTVLKKSCLGRLFIKVYYALSPGIACKLKDNTFINEKVKAILNGLVKQIKKSRNRENV